MSETDETTHSSTGGDWASRARDGHVLDWLRACDPAVEWQVLRDLLEAPETDWGQVRARVETEGWGARLLAEQGPDGLWATGAYFPGDFSQELYEQEGQPWTATTHVLTELRLLGLPPDSAAAKRTVALLRDNARWDHEEEPFWEGEVEECINGQALANGASFGVDMSALADRLVSEQQDDGGWNCERAEGSTRSSFDTTINVLEGLLEFERATGGTPGSRAARAAGEEYLLIRSLMRRQSTGDPVDPAYLNLSFPHRWHYDILRGLDYFRASATDQGAGPDARLFEAIELVKARQQPNGRWAAEVRHGGRQWLEFDDGPGSPSPWVTLLALRVLTWAEPDAWGRTLGVAHRE